MRTALLPLLIACQNDTSINRIHGPPEVAIVSPTPLEVLRKGEAHVFLGTATDGFDTPATMTLTWILDRGEEFPSDVDANGDLTLAIDVEPLALGEHLIELKAVDSDGDEALVGVPWVLDGAISAPQVTITAPEDGAFYVPGEEITFVGEATDNNTAADALSFAWTSDLDGALSGAISGDGQSVLFTSALTLGTHAIHLEVTDGDGEVGLDTVTVTIGEEVAPAEPGDLVFSELMINPEIVFDEAGEWVELYNTAGYAIDVAGYTFHDLDLDSEILEGPLLVAPGGYVVLCANVDAALNGGVPCDGAFKRKTSGALALGNSGDEVILSSPTGVVIDEVVYTADWFDAAVSIGLDPDQLDSANNDDESMWCNQTTVTIAGGEPSTPGRANDPCGG